jgi:hypothetical protein
MLCQVILCFGSHGALGRVMDRLGAAGMVSCLIWGVLRSQEGIPDEV